MFDQCLYFNTSALARRLEREWTEAFEPFGVTPPQGFMLRAVLERPGMLQRELSEVLSIARPTATRSLDGLEARGYIGAFDVNRGTGWHQRTAATTALRYAMLDKLPNRPDRDRHTGQPQR